VFEEDLHWIKGLMEGWFEIKVRAILGGDSWDDKEVTILGRIVRWRDYAIEYEADPRHRKIVMEHFGFDTGTRSIGFNGDSEDKVEEGDEELLEKEEAKVFRGLAARLNYMSLDDADLQFGVKVCSRDMANPKKGSWRMMKKMARYLIGREAVVWQFRWQEDTGEAHVFTDSDWGGTKKERKSTSGGVWMIGGHTIKTWSATHPNST
jgi:hypothetical protein